MAVRHGYGKIAGTDALVFAYDTGDTRNSYKGEPTVNIVTNPTFIGTSGTQTHGVSTNWYFSGETGATGFKYYNSSTSPIPLKFPGEGAVITTGAGASNRRIYYNGTVEPNTTYTLSYWFYSSSFGSITNYFFTYKADGTGTTSPAYSQGFTTGQWVFIQQSFTTPADTSNTRQVNWGPVISGSTNSLFAMQRFQIEAKSHATQFVNGTRSSTQGLLDLTGNSTINLANVSFDSNSQMIFDGTDDLMSIAANGTTNYSQPFTIECVFKVDSGATWDNGYRSNIFGIAGSYSGMYGLFKNNNNNVGLQLRDATSTAYATAAGLSKGVYYHLTGTWNGSDTMILYVNGVATQTTSTTKTGATGSPNLYVGGLRAYGGAAGNYYQGEIPVAKYYNRALTAAEVQANFKNYRKRFEGLDYYYDNTTDGGRWIRFWWYTGVGWPGHETEAFGHDFGTFDSSSHYGFQKLPAGLTKSQVELLAKDSSGNIYKWDFANASSTAQRVWDSMTAGTKGAWAEGGAFNPTVIAGAFHGVQQDSWQYRVSEGVASFMLDDDTCDCYSTLNAGHAMCGSSGWNQTYAQPDGAYLRYGVDTLNDGGCLGPLPTRQLELYYRIKQ